MVPYVTVAVLLLYKIWSCSLTRVTIFRQTTWEVINLPSSLSEPSMECFVLPISPNPVPSKPIFTQWKISNSPPFSSVNLLTCSRKSGSSKILYVLWSKTSWRPALNFKQEKKTLQFSNRQIANQESDLKMFWKRKGQRMDQKVKKHEVLFSSGVTGLAEHMGMV